MASLFDPRLFLTLAEELASQDSQETHLRTAVSRAYYAVFLLARTKTGATEISEGIHSAVRRLLIQRGYRLIARDLETLYELRVEADYDLSPEASEEDWIRIWQDAHRLARDLQNRIEGIRVGRLPKNFR